MEVYLVKEEVKIIPVGEAFSKTEEFDGDLKNLTVSDLPVVFKSICSDASWQCGRFAEKVEWRLKPIATRTNDKFDKLKLELVIAKDSLDGYFVVSTPSHEGSGISVLEQLDEELENCHHELSIEVSLCHLSTAQSAVSPETLVSLEADKFERIFCCCVNQDRMQSCLPVRIPGELRKWWELGAAGFIYSKLSVKVKLGVEAVSWAYGYSKAISRPRSDSTDLEIVCKNGEIVKCCRETVASESKVFRNKFEEMEKEGKGEGGPLKLEMEMSKEGVEVLLEYVYGGAGWLSGGTLGCGLAVELLNVGREYDLLILENGMDEIIMAKGSSDFGYFSVEGALDLFLYARTVVGLKHLRDKAVRVLQNYRRNKIDKIVESKEYQNLLQNQPEVAEELEELYGQLE